MLTNPNQPGDDVMTLARELNLRFTSGNGVDVPDRISVPRDEWRALFAALEAAQEGSAVQEYTYARKQAAERAATGLKDGDWYLVRYKGLGKTYEAPALYRGDAEAFYSVEFSGIPTREVEVLNAASHPPALRQPTSVDAEFLSKRLGRVAKLVGVMMPDKSHDQIVELAGTILGEIARKLEKSAPAQEPLKFFCPGCEKEKASGAFSQEPAIPGLCTACDVLISNQPAQPLSNFPELQALVRKGLADGTLIIQGSAQPGQALETLARQPCDAKYEQNCTACNAQDALTALTGAFVRAKGGDDPSKSILIEGGLSRDITIHPAKEGTTP